MNDEVIDYLQTFVLFYELFFSGARAMRARESERGALDQGFFQITCGSVFACDLNELETKLRKGIKLDRVFGLTLMWICFLP